jgi:hypothetical protein
MANRGLLLLLLAAISGPGLSISLAQSQFQIITGAEFDAVAPATINIAGKDSPIAKRNSVLVQSPSGSRAFLGMVDGTGYSTDVAATPGAIIVFEGGRISISGRPLGPGTYGFSWKVPTDGEEGPGTFTLFNKAGAVMSETQAARDASLRTPTPLQVIVLKNGTARFYHGRYSVELR